MGEYKSAAIFTLSSAPSESPTSAENPFALISTNTSSPSYD